MYFVDLALRERFYLWFLLIIVHRFQSFEDFWTINGVDQFTFKNAYLEMELLEESKEWNQSLNKYLIIKIKKNI